METPLCELELCLLKKKREFLMSSESEPSHTLALVWSSDGLNSVHTGCLDSTDHRLWMLLRGEVYCVNFSNCFCSWLHLKTCFCDHTGICFLPTTMRVNRMTLLTTHPPLHWMHIRSTAVIRNVMFKLWLENILSVQADGRHLWDHTTADSQVEEFCFEPSPTVWTGEGSLQKHKQSY